jgi:hypothetical protein
VHSSPLLPAIQYVWLSRIVQHQDLVFVTSVSALLGLAQFIQGVYPCIKERISRREYMSIFAGCEGELDKAYVEEIGYICS